MFAGMALTHTTQELVLA